MQYRSKRLVSLMLVVLMVVSMFPSAALASETETLILGDGIVLGDNVTVITDSEVPTETESTDTESTETESTDTESTETESTETESTETESTETESVETESTETESTETESTETQAPAAEEPEAPADEAAVAAVDTGDIDDAADGAEEWDGANINTVGDLLAFAAAVNGDKTFEGETVNLNADLDLTDVDWTPIGNGTRSGSSYNGYAFKGTFNGGSHTISNLTISSGENAGLFGIVDGGTVMNLTFANVNINTASGDNVGAAVAVLLGNGTVDNVDVTSGTVSAADGVGGVVGRVLAFGTVQNCDNAANVSGKSIGGVVGKAYYTKEDQSMSITNCTNRGTITGTYAAGGIVGLCAGAVSGCKNTGTISATTEAGGIVGEQYANGSISGCENTGAVSSDGQAGGIVGWIRYESSSNYEVVSTIQVTGNTNSGDISGNGEFGYGGIAGNIYDSAVITGNTNSGSVSAPNGSAAGIAGNAYVNPTPVITGNFTISDNTSTATAEEITGETTALTANASSANTDITITVENNTDPSTVTYVVKIGDTGYESLDAALTAAKEAGMTEVEITVLDDIAFSTKVTDFTKVTFTGTDRAQTIDLNLNAAFQDDVELVFNNLTVSRLDTAENAWLYHYFYVTGGLTYNNCKMIGLFNVTAQDTDFIGCAFYNDDTFGNGNYSLWLYNCAEGVEVNITNCTFDVYERAIKIYGDGYSGVMTLNISETAFTSRTADKTVVEMAYDNSTGFGSMNLNITNSTATGFGAPEHIEGEANAWFNVEGSETVSTVTVDDVVVYTDVEPAAVATIGTTGYETIDAALAAAQDGDTITLLADAALTEVHTIEGMTLTIKGDYTLTINDADDNNLLKVAGETTLNISSTLSGEVWLCDGAIVTASTINGNVFVAGNVTFRGANTVNMLYDFGTLVGNYGAEANMEWTVEPGASLNIINKARYGLGYGDNVTINGNLTDAATARESLSAEDASFFTHGLVAQESSGWNCTSSFTAKNAYVIIGSNNSFGNKTGNHGGNYTFTFDNVVLDASRITFYEANSKTTFNFTNSDVVTGTFMTNDADSSFTLTNTKLVSTTTTNGTDENNTNAGELTLVNSSLTYSAEFTNNGTLTLGTGSSLTAPAIVGNGTITIDATGMTEGKVSTITADASDYTGTLKVINAYGLEAEIDENGNIVLVKAVAEVNGTKYESLSEAINAATDGATVTLISDVELADTLTIEKSITLDLNDHTVTGADGAIVFNVKAETTIKNGTITGSAGYGKGIINIYSNLSLNDVAVETSTYHALVFKAGDCTATLTDCSITGAFKGYSGSVWNIQSGTYKARSDSVSDQLNGTASVSGGTFHYAIDEVDCAPGYVVVDNGDGTYTVKHAPACFVDADNDGVLDDGEIVYGNLDQVFANHQEGNVYVVLTDNIVANGQVDTDADAKYYFTTNVAEGVTMDFLFADDWNYVQNMSIGENITLNAPYFLGWANIDIYGTVNAGYAYFNGADVTVHEGGVLNVAGEDPTLQVKGGTTLTVNGTVTAGTLNVWVGESKLIVSGENATVNAGWIDIWNGTPSVTVENGATLDTDAIKASRGGAITVDNATLAADSLELGHNGESAGTLTVTGNSTITGEATLTAVDSTLTGPEGMTVTSDVEGYVVKYSEGTYSLIPAPISVTYGETVDYYGSLAEAFDKAATGSTVTLLSDVELDSYVFVGSGKEVNLNLMGHAITAAESCAGSMFFVGGRAKLTINDSSEDQTGRIDYADNTNVASVITVYDAAELVVNAGTIKGYYYGISGNGGEGRGDTAITINGGSITADGGPTTIDGYPENALVGDGIFHPQEGTLTIFGGTISGPSGIEMRAGTLEVNGGTITATGDKLVAIANGNGNTVYGAAVAISQHSTNLPTSATINGGTLTGAAALYEEDTTNDGSVSGIALTVNGGSFTGDVSSENCLGFIDGGNFTVDLRETDYAGYVVVGYEGVEANADGYYTVQVSATTDGGYDVYVAQNTTTGKYYNDVTNALDEAKSGETVILLSETEGVDIIEDVDILVRNGVTLDINGRTLSTNNLVGFGGSHVYDSTYTGLLDVPAIGDVVLATDNGKNATVPGSMPIWTGTGYVFGRCIVNDFGNQLGLEYIDNDDGTKTVKLTFLTQFTTALLNAYLKDGTDDNAITIIARMTWEDEDGIAYQNYHYSQIQIKNVMGGGKKFAFSIDNYEEFNNLTMTAAVLSDTGVEFYCDTYQITENQ